MRPQYDLSNLVAHPGLIALRLGVGIACSVLGGFVAASIAKHDELLNGGVSGALKFAYGIVTILSSLGDPSGTLFLEGFVIVLCVEGSLAGGYLSRRSRRIRRTTDGG